MSEEHVLEIQPGEDGDDFDAWCSCGWIDTACATEEDAVDVWENHCDVVFMERTMAGGER